MKKGIRKVLMRFFRPSLHRVDGNYKYVFLGTKYGGWPLLANTRYGSTILSFGVGEDISFDLGAIARFGCLVHAFDPTPKSKAWMQKQVASANLIFHPVGISDYDGEARFFAPQNEAHVSFSEAPSHGENVGDAVAARVMRLGSIVEQLKLGKPQIVKMDIEGFEYKVLRDILSGSYRPFQLLVEFHHGMYGRTDHDTREAVKQLKSAGYEIFYVSESGKEYGFALKTTMPGEDSVG
ncbi:Methyltransferase, FkbM family [Mesorhizobium escarrei]|uniref:Methyltransferase, FkbM family n=2 Tax=Mesorhizobium escarrei TaxID=666018 RepID=A0ABN8K9X2_9HYPH|nr:Methyltransferase, FkbM family [Mesorhizobium escarrei]